ncbi:hypothetical protein PR048_008497 [Dryococelus australis]|uniref:Mutator-like transposase domain-containing protein n=1 Tax=Dryococelus australis TaxID=614101 RepID=A0ABQ9HXA6_9NEOP|nr:hypothetical protein PR048_008497 [Dryococelus australis]
MVEVGCYSAKTNNALELTGRIVDINNLLNTIRKLDDHGSFSCKFSDVFVFREVRRGLRNEMSVNTASAVGCVASGSGFSALTELTSAMNIPSMATKIFSRYQYEVFDGFELTVLYEMKRTAE